MSLPSNSHASAFAERVLDLFRDRHEDLRFPDVDSDALEVLALALEERSATVEDAERALQLAKEQREAALASLDGLARKALAYARIYAEGDADLLARVDAVAGGQSERSEFENGKRSAAKRKPRKKDNAEATLFEGGVQEEVHAA